MGGLTRKELVLQLLKRHLNEWVNGTDIATAEVGGSEGLKRLRELRQDGYDIRMRKHPNPDRDIFQYKLVPRAMVSAAPVNPIAKREWSANVLPPGVTVEATHSDESAVFSPGDAGREFPLKRNEDGSIDISWEVCEDCGGRYAVRADHERGDEHKRWKRRSGTLDGAANVDEVEEEEYTFTAQPRGLQFGEAVVCPRCRGVRRKGKVLKSGWRPADEMCMDPKDHKVVCRRCNGYGIVPNKGPVATVETTNE